MFWTKLFQQDYHDAEPEMRPEYLYLFFSKFMVQDGKIVLALPSDCHKLLIANDKLTVRVRNGWPAALESVRTYFFNQILLYRSLLSLEDTYLEG